MKPAHKTVLLWISLIFLFALLFKAFDPGKRGREEITFPQFVEYLKQGKVEEVTFRKSSDLIIGTFKATEGEAQKRHFQTNADISNTRIFETVEKYGITPNYDQPQQTPIWQTVLISWFPLLLLFLVFFLFMRQVQVGSGKAMSFGNARVF